MYLQNILKISQLHIMTIWDSLLQNGTKRTKGMKREKVCYLELFGESFQIMRHLYKRFLEIYFSEEVGNSI